MARTDQAIAGYDAQSAEEIVHRLRKLSQAELKQLEDHERQRGGRATVLEAIRALRDEPPWPGYDDMEVEGVNDALKQRDAQAAERVLEYERRHKARRTIIRFAERRRDGRTRSTAQSGSSRNRSGSARTGRSASSRGRSGGGAASRSTGRSSGGQRSSSDGRSRRTTSSRTRARSASRPTARSGSTSRSRTQARRASRSRSGRSGSGGRAPQSAPSSFRQRLTGAVKGTGHAVETAAQETGQAVGTAAQKARGPAVATGAAAAALGGGLLLGSKLLARPRVLGIPIPGRRSPLGQASKSLSKAGKGIVDSVGG
jgi:hypothetical protein